MANWSFLLIVKRSYWLAYSFHNESRSWRGRSWLAWPSCSPRVM